ncbi:MAG: VanZ family protein [Candidatus Manganitrophus sp.]|nr:VanZ family protein [Candidatus Manganitrophus sp.]MDC4223256.1 VanZ family protein [Candidatus Manganitrophus sp.]WDT71642.1 MAG: VanZ family protein [Candidatus Manganitrophus sp.]WDT81010.1 MAG: VanZ family protein [Candidatus Manganitrophus sp.]
MNRWIGVAVYTLLLYATLPLGRPLLNLVKGVLGSSFSLSMNLILAGIAVTLLASIGREKTEPARKSVLMIIGIALMLVVSPIAMPEERIHLIQYAGLGYLVLRAAQPLRHSRYHSSAHSPALDPFQTGENRPGRWGRLFQGGIGVALGFVFTVGVGDEIIQWILPNRIFDLRDIFFNWVGGIAGILLQAGTHPGSLSS